MTTAWRICRRPFADLLGEGAKLLGGRWNSPGYSLIYAAETAALAVLEVRVHLDLDWDTLPDDYVLIELDVGALPSEDVSEIPNDPKAFGDEWLASRRSAILRVPSIIVPESRNVLINPLHPNASGLAVAMMRPFRFDPRLWMTQR